VRRQRDDAIVFFGPNRQRRGVERRNEGARAAVELLVSAGNVLPAFISLVIVL